jgi:hypothetical protein
MTSDTQHTICTLVSEIDELHAENAKLRSQLETARADAQFYKHQERSGW